MNRANRGRRCVHARCFENAKSYREHTSVPCSPATPVGEVGLSMRWLAHHGSPLLLVSVPSRGNGVIDSIDNEKSAC